ncbi:MAG: hypothetical protein CMH57_04375 [Myxococcales bacterium]|nr:hypothetical protein [Myxococcales bacterium]
MTSHHRHTTTHRAAALLLALCLALSAAPPRRVHAQPDEVREVSPDEAEEPLTLEATLDRAKIATVDGDYERVVELLGPLVEARDGEPAPLDELEAEAQVEVLRLLGVALLLRNPPSQEAAERVFVTLLKRQPDFQFVQGLHPQEAIDLLALVRRKYADELPRPRETDPNSGERLIYIQREVERNELWLVFVPFGTGQYQNDDMFKFWLFCSLEVAALSVNVFSFTRAEGLRSPNGLYTPENKEKAEDWQQAQFLSLGIFGALVLAGVIDAWVGYEPETVRIRTLDQPPPELTLRAPGAPRRAALDVTARRQRPRAPLVPLIAPTPGAPPSFCQGFGALGGCSDAGSSGITLGVALPF